jgi:glycosyltransferase involved in cell wall biosynthesis
VEVRVLVFHGYLLRGTGSNVYNASLARALVGLGHEVHLLCQDARALEREWVDALGRWREGVLEVEARRRPARCTVYLPDIGGLLPVYVRDAYEGFEARPFTELADAELDAYTERNVSAVRDVVERVRPDVALANHEVMGPAILARALGTGPPYAVKVHGSALEYTVRPDPERFVPLAREGLRAARGVLVGSRHSAERLWEVVDDPDLPPKTRLGPPGVDTDSFCPRPPPDAARGLEALAARLEHGGEAAWGGEVGAAGALRALDPERDRIVCFVGKLIVSKGIDLLVVAWPLVVHAVPEARLCVVGFGTYRTGVERLLAALRARDLAALREVALRGRDLEGGPAGPLRHVLDFLDALEPSRADLYAAAAPGAAERVHLTGRLEHEDLPDLLAAAEAQVVPSTFPEAFGMVAVEAAACGALPIVAAHSGLAEVSTVLADAVDPELRRLLAFEVGPRAVEEIADRLVTWLRLEPSARERASLAVSSAARSRYGWARVAEGVVAAAEGRLEELAPAVDAPATIAHRAG